MKNLQVHPNVESIAGPFKGILLDAFGVFWAGGSMGPYPKIASVMSSLVKGGKIVGILSNTTRRARMEVDKLQRHGLYLGEHFHFFMSSGEITHEAFSQNNLPFTPRKKKFWVLGKGHSLCPHKAIFADTEYEETEVLEEADFIYVAVPHLSGEDQIDPEVFRASVEEISHTDIPMVCANPDRFAHEGDPLRAVVRQGAIADLYKECGGSVVFMGKPEPIAYKRAMQEFALHSDLNCSDVLMVGDTPETDIRGANRMEMATALTVETGLMSDRVRSLGLQGAIDQLADDDKPDFLIQRL